MSAALTAVTATGAVCRFSDRFSDVMMTSSSAVPDVVCAYEYWQDIPAIPPANASRPAVTEGTLIVLSPHLGFLACDVFMVIYFNFSIVGDADTLI